MVEAGSSRHEAAEHFGVSVSSVVKWMQRWKECRNATPKPRGGSISPLEQQAERVVAVVTEQPDLTLEETAAELRRHRIRTSRSSLSRFFHRHDITVKKKPASCRAGTGRCGSGAPTLDPRARPA
jgi:transposase